MSTLRLRTLFPHLLHDLRAADRCSRLCSSRLLSIRSTHAAVTSDADAGHMPAPLTDTLGRRHNYLRISLTERCNLRCKYCMPAEGVPLSARRALLTTEELLRLTRVFVSLGVDKVRLTGGEPTLREDLADIIKSIREMGVSAVSITTNGLVLVRRLPGLQRAGLNAINVSVDSLRPHRYELISRRKGLSRVLAGVDLALQLGYRPLKINVVLMRDFNEDEVCDFVELTRDREIEVRFIEFMPFSGNKWDSEKLVPYREALRVITARHPDLQALVPDPHHTARMWQVPGYVGKVGFIASMTQPFCSTCNRLRITADGNLKVCLFGAAEVSLRDAVREGATDAQLGELVQSALRNKRPQHAAVHVRAAGPGVRCGARRGFSTSAAVTAGSFSHLDAQGRARMVDVGSKSITVRVAEAECFLHVSASLLQLLLDARLPKGEAMTVAEVAGVLAAKRTSDLIPLCHPLPLDVVRVTLDLPTSADASGGGAVRVTCHVTVTARTGAEMEALTGAAVAALAMYDMCKSVDKEMYITDLRVTRKRGGKSDYPQISPQANIESYQPADCHY